MLKTLTHPTEMIFQFEILWFRFGFALANLGDINKDRYEDLAVGAPYEGNGVVYIYLGSKHGIITEPSQVLIKSNQNIIN